MYWFETKDCENSPVISTRVRFARNLEGKKFPQKLTGAEKREICEQVKSAFADEKMLFVDYGTAEKTVKEAYVQTHLASRALAAAGEGAGLLLSEAGDVAIMINEEDHVRLQAISKGKKIRETFEKAKAWETRLEEKVPMAFEEPFGYLTACPTNLGAAMRASVMIHLPCLKVTGRLNALTRYLNDAGFTVRGLFGEGSEESGAIFQISNQMSKSAAPEEIISSFERIVEQIILEEEKAKDLLLQTREKELEDSVCRAIGTLKYARRMAFSEWISLYSLVRLGKEIGLEEAEKCENLDRMLIEAMPAYLQLRNAELLAPNLRDEYRAARIREMLG